MVFGGIFAKCTTALWIKDLQRVLCPSLRQSKSWFRPILRKHKILKQFAREQWLHSAWAHVKRTFSAGIKNILMSQSRPQFAFDVNRELNLTSWFLKSNFWWDQKQFAINNAREFYCHMFGAMEQCAIAGWLMSTNHLGSSEKQLGGEHAWHSRGNNWPRWFFLFHTQ